MAETSRLMGLLLLVLVILSHSAGALPLRTNDVASAGFVRASCRGTRFPTKCVQSLMSFAPTIKQSPKQLAHTALTVSLSKAQSTTAFMNKLAKMRSLKPRERSALIDCRQVIGDAVDKLNDSIRELKLVGFGPRSRWHVSNLQTWVSAALTNENTCVDGFSDRSLNGRVKLSMRTRILDVSQTTSNALALINNYRTRL